MIVLKQKTLMSAVFLVALAAFALFQSSTAHASSYNFNISGDTPAMKYFKTHSMAYIKAHSTLIGHIRSAQPNAGVGGGGGGGCIGTGNYPHYNQLMDRNNYYAEQDVTFEGSSSVCGIPTVYYHNCTRNYGIYGNMGILTGISITYCGDWADQSNWQRVAEDDFTLTGNQINSSAWQTVECDQYGNIYTTQHDSSQVG